MKVSTVFALSAVLLVTACAGEKSPWTAIQDHFRQANAAGAAGVGDPAIAPGAAAAATPKPKPVAPKISMTYCEACLVESSGRVMTTSDALVGDLEQVAQAGDEISFVGWAADTKAGEPAKSVVLVSDGKIVASAEPSQPRPDVSAALKLVKKIQFGFDLRVPSSQVGADAWVWMVGADGKARRIDKRFRR